jgi:hypothetical protein
MKSSLYCLIPFLPLFCNCKFRRLDSVQFLCSQVGSRLETLLTLLNWTLLYNHFTRTRQKTEPHYCWEGVFTAPLHSNGSYLIVGYSLPRERVYRAVAYQWTSPLTSLFRLSGVMSQCVEWRQRAQVKGHDYFILFNIQKSCCFMKTIQYTEKIVLAKEYSWSNNYEFFLQDPVWKFPWVSMLWTD